MRYRIFFRTLRYVAYHWLPPFFGGCALAMALITWGNLELIELLDETFNASFNAVVTACAR